MKKQKLLDSHAALVYLKKEKGYQKVKAELKAADKANLPLLMSEINIGEVYYTVFRAKLGLNLEEFLSLFLSLPIQPVSVDFDLILESAKIKSKYPLSYADAFVIATALREKATIITGDSEFKAVSKMVPIDWLNV